MIMSDNIKIILVAGARPNFMKIAPLIRAIDVRNKSKKWGNIKIDAILVHTGQHYDYEMSKIFFQDLQLPQPDIDLEVGSASHAVQTATIMIRFEKVCLEEKPDWVVVVGDVNSTMACALVAAKIGIKVGHVEAGLRSLDRSMPEEINRVVTDSLADLLFTPSKDADINLLKEGIPSSKIKFVGNIMIDTLMVNLDKVRQRKTYSHFGLKGKDYVFVTLHRPHNVDNKKSLSSIMEHLVRLSNRLYVIFPLHPRTKKNIDKYKLFPNKNNIPRLLFHEPLSYIDSISLVDKARFVLTDSGGLQEETTFLNIPCLTLRPNTERPITIIQGTNKLTSLETLTNDFDNLLDGNHPKGKNPEFWDGTTGERIIKILIDQFQGS